MQLQESDKSFRKERNTYTWFVYMALIYHGSCTEFNQLSSMTNIKANLNWMLISSKINNKFHLKSTINSF